MHSPLTALKSIATIVPHQKPHNWPSSHNAYKVHATGAHDVSINNIDLETTNPWTTIILISVPLITIILLMVILTKSNMANIMNRLFGPGQQNTDCHQPVNGAIRSHSESKIASNRRRTSSSTTASSSSNNSRQGTMTTDSNQAIDKEQPPPQGSGMRKRSLNLSVKSLITTLVTSMSSSNSTSPLNSPSVPITHQSPRSAPLVISDKRPQGQSELSDGQSMGPDGKNCLNPDKSNHTHPTEAQSNITSPNKHINDVIAKVQEDESMIESRQRGEDNLSDFNNRTANEFFVRRRNVTARSGRRSMFKQTPRRALQSHDPNKHVSKCVGSYKPSTFTTKQQADNARDKRTNLPIISLPYVVAHESIVIDVNPDNYDSRDSAMDRDSGNGGESDKSQQLPRVLQQALSPPPPVSPYALSLPRSHSDSINPSLGTSESEVYVSPLPLPKERYPIRKPYARILRGVVFAMSGLVNPKRAAIKDLAIAMGAKYSPNWGRSCTHLICGYKNTPLYVAALGRGRIVREHWIVECHQEQMLIDWRTYKLDERPFPESDEEFDTSQETLMTSNHTACVEESRRTHVNCSHEKELVEIPGGMVHGEETHGRIII
ncbi:DNA repair protein XRCC1, partial [Fragariocoptes setiger]